MGPVLVSALLGGAQAGIGLLQRGAANRRRKKAMEEMEYDIPSGITEQVQMARARASQNEMPGTDAFRSRVESDMSGTLQKGEAVSDTASDVLGLYAKMYGSKSSIESDILQKGAQYKSANELELMKSLGLMAEAENQQFHYNRYVPFLSDMQYSSEQSAGGAANIAGGLQTAYGGWMNNWMMDQYKEIYGVGNTDNKTKDPFSRQDRNAPVLPDNLTPRTNWWEDPIT